MIGTIHAFSKIFKGLEIDNASSQHLQGLDVEISQQIQKIFITHTMHCEIENGVGGVTTIQIHPAEN